MARIRRFDGTKIYHDFPGLEHAPTRDVLFYTVGISADNFGLFSHAVMGIAEGTGQDPYTVQDRLDILTERNVIVPYESDGSRYFAFRKWEDYQKVKYPGSPACPLPTEEVLRMLSKETREALLRFRGKGSQDGDAKCGRAVAVAVAVADVGNANAFPSPTETEWSASQWALRYFYWRLRRHTNLPKPVMPFGRAARFMAAREKDAVDGEPVYDVADFQALVDEFFDRRIRGDKSSANWSLFESAWNALAIAVQKRRRAK